MIINPEFLFSFVLASLAIAISPGPSNAFLMAQTFRLGRAAGFQSALGFAVGGVVHTTFAVLGLTALLATSETAYKTVQYIGAAYLCYLGVKTFYESYKKTNTSEGTSQAIPSVTGKKIFFQALMTEVLNPKVALFFIAFIPQFVDATLDTPTWIQLAIFGLLYPILAFPVDGAYIFSGDKIARYFERHPSAPKWIDRVSGAIFIALAINLLR